MQTKWFKAVLVTGLLLTLWPAYGQVLLSEQEKAFVRSHPVWRVHTAAIWPPYNYHEFGEPKGFAVELLTIAAQRAGAQISWVDSDSWRDSAQLFADNKIDLSIHLANAPDAAGQTIHGAKPLYSTWSALVVGQEPVEADNLATLNGRRVAVIRGSLEEAVLASRYPLVQRVAVEDSIRLLEAVKNGEAATAIGSERVLSYHLNRYVVANVTLQSLESHPEFGLREHHVAISRDKPELTGIIDKALQSLSPEELDALVHKWFRSLDSPRVQVLNLSKKQRDYLNAKGEIRFCSHNDMMPVEGTAGGSLQGMSSEYISFVSQSLAVPMRLVSSQSWSEAQFKLKTRSCDMLTMVTARKNRYSYASYTQPYLSLQMAVVVHQHNPYAADLATLSGRTIGFARQSGMGRDLRRMYPKVNFVEVGDTEAGLEQVENNHLFGYVGLLPRMTYLLQHRFPNLMVASQLSEPVLISAAVRNDEPELEQIMNLAFRNMDVKLHTSILNSWAPVEYRPKPDLRLVWAVMLIALVIIGAIGYSYYILRIQYNKLKDLSTRDRLTGLYNRYTLDMALGEQLSQYQFSQQPFSVVLADVDHFKILNDRFGHLIGDEVLINVAQVFTTHASSADVVGRWGGEEFLLICPNRTEQQALRLAETLREQVESLVHEQAGSLTCSFGVAEYHQGLSISDLIQRADRVLYQSKRAGRNTVTVYSHYRPAAGDES